MCSANSTNSSSPELNAKIEEWLKWDKNEKTSAAIKKLVSEKKFDELSKILLKRLSFGTAGLRGKMEAGYACMNDLVIIQTAQGLLKYFENDADCGDRCLLKNNGIIVGYDGRHNSRRWAELTSCIFVNAGYKVKMFSDVTPTPFVPFSVTKYNCAVGVMVTASHNPKEDNGYKVYGSNGTQIISPVDKHIQSSILNSLEPDLNSWNTDILRDHCLYTDPLSDVLTDYLRVINNTILHEHKELNKKMDLKFTYTAMHGVGYNYVSSVFKEVGLHMVPVKEQIYPDPDFPTVKFPNPEEGKSSLDLSFKTANQNCSNLIAANDPDADRFAAAEKHPVTGEWKVFTGNELGALLGWWMLHCYKLKNPGKSLENVYMLNSTVSSMILRSMSKAEGFKFEETLTGFKWMGNKSIELMKEGKEILFAFEESIGFMCTSTVLDKDGVSAAFQFGTMASYIYSQNKTLVEKLKEIYDIYGQHISKNSYYLCYDPEKINTIFTRIRNFNGQNMYPTGILNEKYKITTIRDLTTGFDSNKSDNKAVLPVDPKNHMITFNFDNGLVCTLRTSGTEPKVKYYTEMCASPDIKDTEKIKETLHEMIKAICDELLQPQQNGLIPQAD